MPLVTVPGGSLIIPMDTVYQDMGMFQAYGLMDQLLTNRIPVMWAIQPGKPFSGTDVVASAIDLRTGALIADHAYAGGPFLIDAQYAEAAAPIIHAWQAVHTTAVHVATDAFETPTFATMTRSPRIAVAQPYAASVFDYLNAAGIPDSADRPWSSASLDALGPTDLANGALFGYETGLDAGRVYDLLIVPAAPAAIWSDPDTLAQLDKFVQQGGYLHALGHSIGTLENQIFFLTAEGIPAFGNKGQPGSFTAEMPDSGLGQAVPTYEPQQLPEPNPLMPFPADRTWQRDQPGLIYLPGTETLASFRDAGGERHDFMVAGPYKGGSGAGKVSYEGGGAFNCSVPYSQNSEAPYVRFVLNAVMLPVALPHPMAEAAPDEILQPAGGHLLNAPDDGCPDESPCAAQNCGPAPMPVITKTPATTTVPPGTEVTWTLETANTGINTLFEVVITDTLPAGFAFISATPAPSSISFGPGGETVITWTAPAIPSSIPTGAGPTITLTALASDVAGTYVNQATLSGKDLLGIPHSATTTAEVIVEMVPPPPPTVEIISPPEGSTICGSVTISATASSPAGILNVAFAFSLDGGATWVPIGTDTSGPPFSVMFDTTTVPDGPILIRAVATDNLGRTATDINAYVVDNTPPVVAITSPANGAVVSGTITVTGAATDNIALAFVEWLIDGTVVATQTTPPFELVIDTTQLSEGPHTITLRACDFCPNCAATSITIIVENVPPPPPTVEIISPPEGSTICGSVTISATASSPAGILNVAFAFSLDGGVTWVPIGTDTSGPPFSVMFDTTTVPDGPTLIRAVATDNLGRTATDINAYVVDNTPPVVAITSPANGAVVSGTITVTGTATDNIALAFVEWLIDGTVVATQTTPPFELVIDTTQLSEGPHTITLRACDFCPNCAATSITIIVENVPPPPPTVEIISPPEGSTICGTVNISANASSPAGILNVAFAFSLDGGTTWVPIGTDTSGPPFSVMFDTTTVPDGPILIRAVATDNLGRTATDINAYVVDNTPPVVAITSPANGAVVSGTITVTGTATDNIALAFVQWLVDGTVVATQTAPPFQLVLDTTQLTPGPHTITLRACDNCPNCASTSITIFVRTPPPPPVSRQVGVDHAIAIPRKKPDVEQILDQRVDVTVETVHVVATPLGTKVVVTGKVCVLLTYVAKVRDQSVHAVEACFPFSTFMLVPGLAPDASVNVTAAVEFTQFQVIDPRTISKFIVLLVTATPL